MIIEIHQPELEKTIQRWMDDGLFHSHEDLLRKAFDALERPPQILRSSLEDKNLLELAAPVRGLLADEEVNTLFQRSPSVSRAVDLA